MKQPRPRGAAIDNLRFRSWRETFSSFRHTVNDNSIDRWINQFDENDKDLAARILDCVEFISSEQIASGFRQILASLPGWSSNRDERIGKWRFVPFSGSAGESGDSMTHKFRHATGLGGKKNSELFIYRRDLPSQMFSQDDTVVFIDDFSGTGTQVCEYWEELKELIFEQPRIYLVLAGVNHRAIQRISVETDLQVASHFEFSENDNIFSESCRHFTNKEKEIILSYCKRADRRTPKGSGDCGMILVFSHNTPNNSIPILHTNHDVWEGLFRRYD